MPSRSSGRPKPDERIVRALRPRRRSLNVRCSAATNDEPKPNGTISRAPSSSSTARWKPRAEKPSLHQLDPVDPLGGDHLPDVRQVALGRLDPVPRRDLGRGLVGERPRDRRLQLGQPGVTEALQRADHRRVAGPRLGAQLDGGPVEQLLRGHLPEQPAHVLRGRRQAVPVLPDACAQICDALISRQLCYSGAICVWSRSITNESYSRCLICNEFRTPGSGVYFRCRVPESSRCRARRRSTAASSTAREAADLIAAAIAYYREGFARQAGLELGPGAGAHPAVAAAHRAGLPRTARGDGRASPTARASSWPRSSRSTAAARSCTTTGSPRSTTRGRAATIDGCTSFSLTDERRRRRPRLRRAELGLAPRRPRHGRRAAGRPAAQADADHAARGRPDRPARRQLPRASRSTPTASAAGSTTRSACRRPSSGAPSSTPTTSPTRSRC